MTNPRKSSLLWKISFLYGAFLAACMCRAAVDPLAFDAGKYTVKVLAFGGRTISYRAYEGIVYVTNPVDAKYQSMNIYVPVEYYEGKSIGTYNAENAPIFFPNTVGGYMPGAPGTPRLGGGMGMPPPSDTAGPGGGGSPNAIALALAKGFIVAAPGARGRVLKDESGVFTGKAPACIVDLKAAVRFLRHNDKVIPGSAERIISNGTSAGGALSALVGATGNAADYEPYLKAIGAAEERDDIFASSCYCPITNLDHADAAYEWLFNGLDSYESRGRTGTMTDVQIKASAQLKLLFPGYLNSLGLRKADGTILALEPNGEGSFKDYVKSCVLASAQRALAGGKDLSGLAWLRIEDSKVADLDFNKFVAYAKRMKTTPAFDSFDLKSPENNLFGTAKIDNQHFTAFSAGNSNDPSLAEPALVKMMNPMNYIGSEGVSTAPHWRIRHGSIDRDTSLAIPIILATALRNKGYAVDFSLPWDRGHAGDYDLEELFAWVGSLCK